MKKILMCFMILTVLGLSVYLPDLLFQLEDNYRQESYFTIEKQSKKIDVQSEDVYLVRAIHNLDSRYANVMIGSSKVISNQTKMIVEQNNEEVFDKIEAELNKLVNLKILREQILVDFNHEKSLSKVVEKQYQNKEEKYIIRQFIVQMKEYEIIMDVEQKIGKVLYLAVPRNKTVQDSTRQAMLENYIRYLELSILDDWKYENELWISEKADLVVNFSNIGEEFMFFMIHSTFREPYLIESK